MMNDGEVVVAEVLFEGTNVHRQGNHDHLIHVDGGMARYLIRLDSHVPITTSERHEYFPDLAWDVDLRRKGLRGRLSSSLGLDDNRDGVASPPSITAEHWRFRRRTNVEVFQKEARCGEEAGEAVNGKIHRRDHVLSLIEEGGRRKQTWYGNCRRIPSPRHVS